MADFLFPIALIYFLCIVYAKKRILSRYSLILQFVIAWGILELAWLNAVISIATLIMAVGDLGDWSFMTLIGFSLTAYNIFQLAEIHYTGKQSKHVFSKSLTAGLGENYIEDILPEREKLIAGGPSKHQWLKPFRFNTQNMINTDNIVYGPNEMNTLTLSVPKADSKKLRPVMLQIHGGGWVLGHSQYQGLPLRNKLIDAGWIFISIDYRLSPKHKFPAHLIDCKQALHWAKENIEEYGGDPNFIMTTGGSAGGHLCALLALTENQQQETLQPGFESADTSVQGAIPVYGIYDFIDRNQHRSQLSMTPFLEKTVMPYKLDERANHKIDLWELASPIAQVHENRPPLMLLHGKLDTLAFVEDAQFFVQALRDSSNNTCIYAELEETQHAFEIFYSPRCLHSIHAMHTFAEHTYSQYLKGDYISADTSKK